MNNTKSAYAPPWSTQINLRTLHVISSFYMGACMNDSQHTCRTTIFVRLPVKYMTIAHVKGTRHTHTKATDFAPACARRAIEFRCAGWADRPTVDCRRRHLRAFFVSAQKRRARQAANDDAGATHTENKHQTRAI